MRSPGVTIVLPFRDHEHLVGRACRNLAEHFEGLEQGFEIIAVDEGSGDNSHAVLALLSQEIQGLKVMVGKGYGAGSKEAVGKIVVLTTPESAAAGISESLMSSLREVEAGRVQLQQVDENLLVCDGVAAQKVLAKSRSHRRGAERKLLRRARARGLTVRTYGPDDARSSSVGRLLSAFRPRLSLLHWPS